MADVKKEIHWGRLMTCYSGRPANVNDMMARSFAGAGHAEAVVDGDTRVTYQALDQAANALAAGLVRRGVRPGDRVAVMLPNRLEAAVSVLGIARAGAVLVPLGTRLKRPEIAYIFSDAMPVALIHDPAYAADLPENGPAPEMRFDCSAAAWTDLLATSAGSHVAPDIDEEQPFGVLYTSGTTGKPKGALLTHLNVVHSCLHWADVHRLTRNECTMLCIPWSHVAGLCGVLLPFLALGATLVMMADFQRRAFLELAQNERITHALMVPAMYGLCLLESDLTSFDLGSWRVGAYGSAPMPYPTIRRFAEAFPQLEMCNCYGATETTSPATMMPRGDGVTHLESIGKVVPCGDIVVMDEQGRELPPGEDGELWVAGPMVVPGYWKNPEANAAAFEAGYWKSGDIGSIDAGGYVRIADRKKDMINRGGFKVFPAEVESVLMGIAGVVEAAVVGRPDDILGESVIAFLNVISSEVEEDSVRQYCAERMADYKVPGRVVIGRQPLPRNGNGKIQKVDLREAANSLPVASRPAPARA
jgi:long-chain acyl-CoA synthetase